MGCRRAVSSFRQEGSVTLYDMGFGPWLFFALPSLLLVGFILDYLWNLIVLSVALAVIRKLSVSGLSGATLDQPTALGKISWRRRLAYCLIVTAVGLGIGVIWFTLDLLPIPTLPSPVLSPLLLLPLAMAALGIVNSVLSQRFFRLKRKQAASFGVAMGVFTAPWLLAVGGYW